MWKRLKDALSVNGEFQYMLKPKTVLIVDDDQQIVDGINLRLKRAGYITMIASDGSQGVFAAVQSLPDAIILDVRMPKLDGISALKKLRSTRETRSIPVMMLSASIQDKQPALDAGARFFIAKPYQSATLLKAVQTVTSGA